MRSIFSGKYISALFLLFFIFSANTQAQNELRVLLEPDVKFGYGPDSRWSHSFTVGNRELLYKNEETYFQLRHIEFTQFTKYELNDRNEIGLGIRYRFEEAFDDMEQDELRIMENYEHTRSFTNFVLSHELRLEQRFREINTFRTRYELAFEFPLGGNLENADTFLSAATEALWSMGREERPAFEQRFTVEVEKALWENTAGSFGLEYRFGDYTRVPSNTLVIQAGLAFDI